MRTSSPVPLSRKLTFPGLEREGEESPWYFGSFRHFARGGERGGGGDGREPGGRGAAVQAAKISTKCAGGRYLTLSPTLYLPTSRRRTILVPSLVVRTIAAAFGPGAAITRALALLARKFAASLT